MISVRWAEPRTRSAKPPRPRPPTTTSSGWTCPSKVQNPEQRRSGRAMKHLRGDHQVGVLICPPGQLLTQGTVSIAVTQRPVVESCVDVGGPAAGGVATAVHRVHHPITQVGFIESKRQGIVGVRRAVEADDDQARAPDNSREWVLPYDDNRAAPARDDAGGDRARRNLGELVVPWRSDHRQRPASPGTIQHLDRRADTDH